MSVDPERNFTILERARLGLAATYFERLMANNDPNTAVEIFKTWLEEKLANSWSGSQITQEAVITGLSSQVKTPNSSSFPRSQD